MSCAGMHMVTLTSSYERDSGLWSSWCNAKLFKAIWTGLRTLLLSGYKVSTRKKNWGKHCWRGSEHKQFWCNCFLWSYSVLNGAFNPTLLHNFFPFIIKANTCREGFFSAHPCDLGVDMSYLVVWNSWYAFTGWKNIYTSPWFVSSGLDK